MRDNQFRNFRRGMEHIHEGESGFGTAKAVEFIIRSISRHATEIIRAHDFRADNSDIGHDFDAAIYRYIRASNPDLSDLDVVESIGERS